MRHPPPLGAHTSAPLHVMSAQQRRRDVVAAAKQIMGGSLLRVGLVLSRAWQRAARGNTAAVLRVLGGSQKKGRY